MSLPPPAVPLLAVLGLAVAGPPGCSKSDRPPPGARAPGKATLPALELPEIAPRRASIWRWVSLPATAEPWQEVTLQARVSGYLSGIAVDRGDRVKSGAKLAEIAVPELRAERLKWQAELALAEQDVQRLGAAMQRAADLVTPQSVDAARAKRDVARAGLESTEAKLGYASFAAPFAGIVTGRFVDVGSYASEGTKLVSLVDDSKLRIRFGIPESEAPLVKNGLPVKLAAEGLPGRSFEAVVSRNAGALDPATRTLPVEADLENAGHLVKPGMYLAARIGLERHDRALVIPAEALLSEKTRSSVFKLVDGKARKTPVEVGFQDGENVELLDGVAEGDRLLVFGRTALSDGQPVTGKAAP